MSTYSQLKDKKRGLSESSVSSTKPTKRRQTFNHFITLSQAMMAYPQCFEDTKISVVQKFISEIDLLPKRFYKIDTLYLSNNNIRSLQGLQQFFNLRTVSLANNEIDDASSLYILEMLPSIENLALNGNPVCRLANYRSLVISLLPCLKSLDGKPVTMEEKRKSEVNLKTQGGLLDHMLSNYCEIIKLNNLCKKLETHKAILNRTPRHKREYVPLDIQKWKEMCDYENELDELSKNTLKSNLLKDASTLKVELGLRDEENEKAFTQLIICQQKKIAQLTLHAEEIVREMAAFYSDNPPQHKNRLPTEYKSSNSPQKDFYVPGMSKSVSSLRAASAGSPKPSSARNKHVTISEKQPVELDFKEMLGNEPRSLRGAKRHDNQGSDIFGGRGMMQKLTKNAVGQLFTEPTEPNPNYPVKALSSGIESGLGPRLSPGPAYQSISSEIAKSVKNSAYKNNMSDIISPVKSRRVTDMSRMETSPSHKDECCRTLHKRVVTNDGDYVNTRYKSPFKKRLEEKGKLIDNLSQDLRVKNQELIKYEGFTKQLVDKLRAYQNQNNFNVIFAQDEIDAITKELEKSVRSQTYLEEAVGDLKSALNDVQRRNIDLEEKNRLLDEIEVKANQYAKELEERRLDESKTALAAAFYNSKLKRRQFKLFKQACKVNKHVNKFSSLKRTKKTKKLLKNIMHAWSRMVYVSQLIREKQQAKRTKLLMGVFFNWQGHTLSSKRMKYHLQEKKENLMHKAWMTWKQFHAQAARIKIQQDKINAYYIHRLKRRTFKRFMDIRRRAQYGHAEEKMALKKAQKYQAFFVKRSIFSRWSEWVKTEVKPKRVDNKKAYELRRKNLLKFGMKVWNKYQQIRKALHDKVQRKVNWRNNEVIAKSLRLWKHFIKAVVPAQLAEQEKIEAFTKKRLFGIWTNQFAQKQKIKAFTTKVVEKKKNALVEHVFKHLAKLRLKKKQLHYFSKVIATKHENIKAKSYFASWNNLHQSLVEARQKATEERKQLLLPHFQAWKQFKAMSIAEKTRREKIEKRIQRREKTKLGNIFDAILAYSRLQKRNRGVLELLTARRKNNMYKGVLFELMKHARSSMKQTVVRVLAKSTLLQVNAEDNEIYVNELDKEKLELKDKARLWQEEVVKLNIQIEERDREMNNMRRVINQAEKNEKNLVDEINLKGSIVKELETKIHRDVAEHGLMYNEYEKEIVLLKEQRSDLLRRIGQLESELNFKHKAVVSTEKALLEKSHQAEGMVKDIEQKFASSVSMANEFRTAIEVKDEQIQSLMSQLHKALEDKQELRTALNDTYRTTKEARDIYENRLKTLERQHLEMLDSVEYYRQGVNRQVRSNSNLRGELRKTQHRLDIASLNGQEGDEKLYTSLRKEANTDVRIPSPERARSPRVDKYRREYSAEQREYRKQKANLDSKMVALESYISKSNDQDMTPLLSPSAPFGRSQVRFNLKDSNRSLPGTASQARFASSASSTKYNESISDFPTKDTVRKTAVFRANDLGSTINSERSFTRDDEPLTINYLQARDVKEKASRERSRSRSPLAVSLNSPSRKNPKSCLKPTPLVTPTNVAPQDYERQKKDREQRRLDLELRLDSLTQSLRDDLQKARKEKC